MIRKSLKYFPQLTPYDCGLACNCYPDAENYVFSTGLTSEATLEFDKILYMDHLLETYEGFLFKEDDFKHTSPKKFLKRIKKLSPDLKDVSEEGDVVETLNSLIRNYDFVKYISPKYQKKLSDYHKSFLPM